MEGNHNMRNKLTKFMIVAAAALSLSACGINSVPTAEEAAKAKWADVESTYQRRADLIPNLVETVKGFAAQEQDTLTAVVEARAKATSSQRKRFGRCCKNAAICGGPRRPVTIARTPARYG